MTTYTYCDARTGWLLSCGQPDLPRNRFVPITRTVFGQPDGPDWPQRPVS